jgi:hypothetical protein
METLVLAILLSFASFNAGATIAHEEDKDIILQHQYRVQYVQESSKQALQDVEDAVNANFSKVRGNQTIEKIIVRWKGELK